MLSLPTALLHFLKDVSSIQLIATLVTRAGGEILNARLQY